MQVFTQNLFIFINQLLSDVLVFYLFPKKNQLTKLKIHFVKLFPRAEHNVLGWRCQEIIDFDVMVLFALSYKLISRD